MQQTPLQAHPLEDVQQSFAFLPLGCAMANLSPRAAFVPFPLSSPDWRAATLSLTAQR